MKIREVDVQAVSLVRIDRGKRQGLHLSDLIKIINDSLDPKRKSGYSDLDYHRFMIGLAWESAVFAKGLTFATKEHHAHLMLQHSVERDGIRMTLDAVDHECDLVWESKATWISMNNDITSERFKHYHWQGMAYARAEKMRTVRYPVAYMNGDYAKNFKPIIRCWDVTYTPAELTDNWDMMLRVRDEHLEDLERLNVTNKGRA